VNEIVKGRGAQINVSNKFERLSTYLDDDINKEDELRNKQIQLFESSSRKIISYNKSPDLSFDASINPYQGCEHGCIYCYARNSHEYWGFGSGIDFETKIVIKPDADRLLEKEMIKSSWKPKVVMLSGNTDCYQPLERKFKLTRKLLHVFEKYQNPVGIITKNALIKRDVDILSKLAKNNLVRVIFSINTLNEDLRRVMEPRTAHTKSKLEAMKTLSNAGIATGVMIAPIIPGLNHHEIPKILEVSNEHGALFASYSVVRLNGHLDRIFSDWLEKAFPLKKDKVWNQIKSLHGFKVNQNEFGKRQKGMGEIAEMINQLFKVNHNKFYKGNTIPELNLNSFRRNGNLTLF